MVFARISAALSSERQILVYNRPFRSESPLLVEPHLRMFDVLLKSEYPSGHVSQSAIRACEGDLDQIMRR